MRLRGQSMPIKLPSVHLESSLRLPQILEKHIDSVTVPVYPGNSASILAAKDGPIKDKRLAAGAPALRCQC